ncbi:hypothetical protein [Escherichia coli]|uniref:hypothetical protein n=1 Tax=Escherichia coli TaxID=562 RepID=UPI000A34EC5D|nr:hypothetical protein [Escherichia coli]
MTVVVAPVTSILPSGRAEPKTQADDSSSAAEPPPACLSAIPAGFQGFLPAFFIRYCRLYRILILQLLLKDSELKDMAVEFHKLVNGDAANVIKQIRLLYGEG